MKRLTSAWMLAPLLAVFLPETGCYIPGPPEEDGPAPTRSGGSGGSTTPTAGLHGPVTYRGLGELLEGSMGNVRTFAGRAPDLQIAESSGSDSVRLDAEDTTARWWAMTAITLRGGLRHPDLRPGAVLQFSNVSGARGTTGLNVTVLGCSGPRRNQYTYDRNAENVTVWVHQGSRPELYRLEFVAQFPTSGNPHAVRGAFEYEAL